MKKAPIIVLTGGGSGGHIMPLLSLAHALKKASKNCRVVYFGLKGEGLAEHLKSRYQIFDAVYPIPAGKFRRYHGESLLSHIIDIRSLSLNFLDFFRVLAGIGKARKLLKRLRPDVVFSKGGFVAVPVGIAAASLRIPIVTHDSDTVPGLANRIVGRFAVVHATGMPAENYRYPKESIYYVGTPLDERIKPVTKRLQASFKKELGLPTDSLVLLIGGAGLGARDVNNKVLSIAPTILKDFDTLYIVHMAGQKHQKQVATDYNAALTTELDRVKVIGFTPEFYKYTGAADLIITRAGATTIAELAVQRKATILIPAPHLTGGHQLKNAEELSKKDAALVVPNDAAPQELQDVVKKALQNTAMRYDLADKLSSLAKSDAADMLAELLLKQAEENQK